MADGSVGRQILEWMLATYPADLAAVVLRPESDLTQRVLETGLPYLHSTSSKATAQWLTAQGIEPELGILAWWPAIIREPLLRMPRRGFINTHPSLLPYNRGKHYNFWALVEEAPFGVTLHFVDDGVDTGAIVAQRRIKYSWEDTGGTLYHRALSEMVALFLEVYPQLREGPVEARLQDQAGGSFHRASELDEASRIDLDRSYTARQLLNLLRARTFGGYPACWFESDGMTFEVRVDIRRKVK